MAAWSTRSPDGVALHRCGAGGAGQDRADRVNADCPSVPTDASAGGETRMRTRTFEKFEWKSYGGWISGLLTGKRAEISVNSLGIGSQIQAEWATLLGLTYDPKDDLFEIALDGLDHLIRQPRRISVLEGPRGLESIEIVDAEGSRHVVTLREPLALPSPDRV
jgi:Family of unknown function (DUF5335)